MAKIYRNMQDYAIEIINFETTPFSTLIDYFNKRLNELASQPKVTEIKSAKLVIMYQKPPQIHSAKDYLYSAVIPGTGRHVYHICEIVVFIKSSDPNLPPIECTISYYTEVYFEEAIDAVINEAISRCYRY